MSGTCVCHTTTCTTHLLLHILLHSMSGTCVCHVSTVCACALAAVCGGPGVRCLQQPLGGFLAARGGTAKVLRLGLWIGLGLREWAGLGFEMFDYNYGNACHCDCSGLLAVSAYKCSILATPRYAVKTYRYQACQAQLNPPLNNCPMVENPGSKTRYAQPPLW